MSASSSLNLNQKIKMSKQDTYARYYQRSISFHLSYFGFLTALISFSWAFYRISVDTLMDKSDGQKIIHFFLFISIRLIKINNKHILFLDSQGFIIFRNDTYTYNSPAPVSRSENPGESGWSPCYMLLSLSLWQILETTTVTAMHTFISITVNQISR